MTDATPGTPDVSTPEVPTSSVVVRDQLVRTQKVGKVVSNKMNKSVVVTVDYVRRHPIYHKRITRTSRFMAHDEQNRCNEGDIVRIEETRPMSKNKRWIVREIIESAPTA